MPITLFIIAKNLKPVTYPTVEELRIKSNKFKKFANDSDLIYKADHPSLQCLILTVV